MSCLNPDVNAGRPRRGRPSIFGVRLSHGLVFLSGRLLPRLFLSVLAGVLAVHVWKQGRR